jgi:hypothetical protein
MGDNQCGCSIGYGSTVPKAHISPTRRLTLIKGGLKMFSVNQKREISAAIQKILKDTNHPELPKGEVEFYLHVDGAEKWSWADIRNNGAVQNPSINPFNEKQAERC